MTNSASSSGPSLSKSDASGGVPAASDVCMRRSRSDMTFATFTTCGDACGGGDTVGRRVRG